MLPLVARCGKKVANGCLHARIWRSRSAHERMAAMMALRHEIEANVRLLRFTQYLMLHFIPHWKMRRNAAIFIGYARARLRRPAACALERVQAQRLHEAGAAAAGAERGHSGERVVHDDAKAELAPIAFGDGDITHAACGRSPRPSARQSRA